MALTARWRPDLASFGSAGVAAARGDAECATGGSLVAPVALWPLFESGVVAWKGSAGAGAGTDPYGANGLLDGLAFTDSYGNAGGAGAASVVGAGRPLATGCAVP